MVPPNIDVYTLGFSNRTWEETIEILRRFGIHRVLDIRTLPGSRHTPQFNLEHLAAALPKLNIEYLHLKSLGGLRKPRKEDPTNAGWKNGSFRGYADYMQTAEFDAALEQLIRMFSEERSVYACTEAVFWRCHRALVSDVLLARGYQVHHIFNAQKSEPHRLTRFASVRGDRITYPAEGSSDPVTP